MSTTVLDAWKPKPDAEERVTIRIERTQKFVARELMPGERALAGQALAVAGIDPDTPMEQAAIQMVQAFAESQRGIMDYCARMGMLEKEILVVHHVKVFVNGQLAHEEDLLL